MKDASRRALVAAAVALASLSTACEHTLIRTIPVGASVEWDGKPMGRTPATIFLPRKRSEAGVTVKLRTSDGFIHEERVRPPICPGRVFAAVTTLGISMLFRPIRCFKPAYDFHLQAPVASGRPGDEGNRTSQADRQLEEARRALERGRITPEELELLRAEIYRQEEAKN